MEGAYAMNTEVNEKFEAIVKDIIAGNQVYYYSEADWNHLHNGGVHTWRKRDMFADYLSKFHPGLLKLSQTDLGVGDKWI
jgi:hypothetical protein